MYADKIPSGLPTAPRGRLIRLQSHTKQVDSIKSPVIQFKKTIIQTEQRKIHRGRLWLSDQYYADDGAIVKKDSGLVEEYQKLARWIKKVFHIRKYPKEILK